MFEGEFCVAGFVDFDYECYAAFRIAKREGLAGVFVGDRVHDFEIGIRATLDDAAVKKSLADLGVDIIGGSPEDFAAYIRSEIPKWTAVVKASGATLD